MSDIVKRLRLLQIHQQDNDVGEAADTIEALRAENALLRKELRDADEMLLGQARTIRDYQDAARGERDE